jgi:hypothetical protein
MMKKFIKHIFHIIIIFFISLQSCSVIEQYSTFNAKLYNNQEEKILDKAYNEHDMISIISNNNSCSVIDSVKFKIEVFLGGKIIFLGPPYIPAIPNFLYPFTYLSDNKRKDYCIVISCNTNDSIDINNFHFFRNEKRIFYETVNIVNVINPTTNYISPTNNIKLCSGKYSLIFNFKIRTFSTRKIEVKYKDISLLQIKRKKKLYHKIIFAS